MVNLERALHPDISYRPIRNSDLEVLKKIHADLFPIRPELMDTSFFYNVVNGHDVISWGAVDQNDELIGFLTARVVMAKENEVEDLLRLDPSKSDQKVVHILTLGVIESYRNLSIATSLVREVINYATNAQEHLAVYLHVFCDNTSAIHLYQKMSFQFLRRLPGFYMIGGQQYDALLFVYYIDYV